MRPHWPAAPKQRARGLPRITTIAAHVLDPLPPPPRRHSQAPSSPAAPPPCPPANLTAPVAAAAAQAAAVASRTGPAAGSASAAVTAASPCCSHAAAPAKCTAPASAAGNCSRRAKMRVRWEPAGGLWQGHRRRKHEASAPAPFPCQQAVSPILLPPTVSAERTCRFCFKELPDWRTAHEQLPQATPVMVSRRWASLAQPACLTFALRSSVPSGLGRWASAFKPPAACCPPSSFTSDCGLQQPDPQHPGSARPGGRGPVHPGSAAHLPALRGTPDWGPCTSSGPLVPAVPPAS